MAKALRESGDVEVGPLLDYANNRDLWERCNALADEAGAYGFVARLTLRWRSITRRRSPSF